MRPATGDPRLDRLISPRPAVDPRLDHDRSRGGTLSTEVWLACVMTLFGACLLHAGDTFSNPSYRIIGTFLSQDAAGAAAVGIGAARLVALWRNGRHPGAPLVRVAGCAGGFLSYTALAFGFVLSAPTLSTGLILGVLATAELHASSRSARDAAAYDSLGVRRRRRAREQPAA